MAFNPAKDLGRDNPGFAKHEEALQDDGHRKELAYPDWHHEDAPFYEGRAQGEVSDHGTQRLHH